MEGLTNLDAIIKSAISSLEELQSTAKALKNKSNMDTKLEQAIQDLTESVDDYNKKSVEKDWCL